MRPTPQSTTMEPTELARGNIIEFFWPPIMGAWLKFSTTTSGVAEVESVENFYLFVHS